MNDLFADDFFTGLDLVEDPLPVADAPLDVPATEAVVDTAWFDPGLPDIGALPGDLALPDPFVGGTGFGAAGLVGGLMRRRGGGGGHTGSPAPAPTSRVQTAATLAQLADASASLVQRLGGLRRRREPAKGDEKTE